MEKCSRCGVTVEEVTSTVNAYGRTEALCAACVRANTTFADSFPGGSLYGDGSWGSAEGVAELPERRDFRASTRRR